MEHQQQQEDINYVELLQNIKQDFFRMLNDDFQTYKKTQGIEILAKRQSYNSIPTNDSNFMINYFQHYSLVDIIVGANVEFKLSRLFESDIVKIVEANELYKPLSFQEFKQQCENIEMFRNIIIAGDFKIHKYYFDIYLRHSYFDTLPIYKFDFLKEIRQRERDIKKLK